MLSQKVTITTDSGKEIRGIIGSKPPHVLTPEERKKPMEIKNMFFAVKYLSFVSTSNSLYGVTILPTSTPASSASSLLLTPIYRYGCALAVEVLKRLKDENIGINLYSGATVQEEVAGPPPSLLSLV
jgi:putative aminopeptidase FrvX